MALETSTKAVTSIINTAYTLDSASESYFKESEEKQLTSTSTIYRKTKSAIQVVISLKLSTRRLAHVYQRIYKNLTNIVTPTQSGIYRDTFKEAD